MKSGMLQGILAVVFMAGGLAQASSPSEKLSCTAEARTRWLPEARIREVFGEKQFALVKFKISGGNCYEFYAVGHDDSIVEAYYHPVSGELVRYNRIVRNEARPPAGK